MTMQRKLWALAAAAVLVVAACGGDDDDGAGETTTSAAPATTTSAADTTSTAPEAEQLAIGVMFLDADAHLVTAGRTVDGADAPRAALEALLAGPEGIETELQWSSAIPEGTTVHGVEVADGIATVDLSAEFQSGGGSASMLGRVAQVVYTLTQDALGDVERVKFAIDGAPVDAIGGEGVVVGPEGVTRADFTSVLPAIFVETPTPGADVTSPITVSGMSNTFEATIQYNVTDPEGAIVTEEFFTGGGTLGEWQPFSFEAAFTNDRRAGLGAVILFEISAEDGSQVNVVEIPVEMPLT